MSTDLVHISVTELAGLISSKSVSPIEATRELLNHAKKLNGKLNAYISFREEKALEEARQAEEEISAGRYRGTFHGIPLAIKDNLYVANEITTMGSKIHKNFISKEDATVVAKLRNAGAILAGKLNMHEYAGGISNNNPHFGPARNPWNLDKTPGGSSGGSAVAVAADMAFASLGTDTAGSIRIPSAACGIVGLKPTHGRVSKFGCFPLAWTLDHVGPMGKTVADTAAMLEVIAGFDPRDPTCISTQVPKYSAALTGDVGGLRIGIIEDFFFKDLDSEIERQVRAQIDNLVSEGAKIREVQVPALQHFEWAELATELSEAATIHHRNISTQPENYGDDIRIFFELGELFSAVDYLQAQQVRRQIKQQFSSAFSEVDVIIAPTLPVMPPDIEDTEATLNGRKVDLVDNFIRLVSPGNFTGLPALSVPAGFNGDLPVGLQIIGNTFDEATVLNVGFAVEKTNPCGERTPMTLA